MTNSQRAKLDSYNRVSDFNTKYSTEVATIPEYAMEQTAFQDAVESILEAVNAQTQQSGVANDAVAAAKQTMASLTVKFAMRGAVKAKQLGNLILANQLDEPLTYITIAPKSIAVQRAKELRDYLNNNLGILANVTAADIGDIDAAIAAYNALKDDPTESLQTKKAAGTDILPPFIERADEAEDNMFMLIKSYFADNVVMVNEMELAIKIIHTGVHHTEVEITVVADETGNPVAGATVSDNTSNKQFTTDAHGIAHLGSHRAGHFDFTVNAPGRNTVVLGATVARGTQNAFTVRLTPAN
jgi:hypothetical protein